MVPSGESGQYFRESTRAPLRTQVTLQVDAFKDPEPGFTGNLSLGGMFVELAKPVPVGTIVKFELELESAGDKVQGTAEVVWIRPDRTSGDKPTGVGLQFRHLQGDGDAVVRQAVEEILQSQGLSVEPATVAQPKTRSRPRRPRAPSAAKRPSAPSPPGPKAKKKRKATTTKKRKKSSSKGSNKEASDGEERKKLIVAIILIVILIYVLSRTLG